jgi:hypothetical protein
MRNHTKSRESSSKPWGKAGITKFNIWYYVWDTVVKIKLNAENLKPKATFAQPSSDENSSVLITENEMDTGYNAIYVCNMYGKLCQKGVI